MLSRFSRASFEEPRADRQDVMTRYATFSDFNTFYLAEHADRTCRRLHFVGTSLSLCMLIAAVLSRNPSWLAGALVCGYAFAWAGHFFFEKNRPATFRHSLLRLAADWVMWRDILTGRIRF
jgi:hypothetical protein